MTGTGVAAVTGREAPPHPGSPSDTEPLRLADESDAEDETKKWRTTPGFDAEMVQNGPKTSHEWK